VPNASTTEQISSADTTGAAIPLAYGYVWATGKRAAYYQLQNTGDSDLDFTRVGLWLLGHGEWDGCDELWINDNLIWTSELGDTSQFHFHRGADAVIGSGLLPTSQGPDQGVDIFCRYLPSGINLLCYNRIAYYAICRKQEIQFPVGNPPTQSDPSQWTDIAPVGLWRAQRTRIFDSLGNAAGYAWNTNPAWHFVDVLLRRKIKPDFNIDLVNGPDPLTAAEQARFNWESIFESAQYFDQLLANGRRRFCGNYAFTSQTTLNAVLEQILLCCRSSMQEYAGQIYLICDQPRPSVFIFSRQHSISLEPNDNALHTSANRFVAPFRDILLPQAAQIASINNWVVTTQLPHPFNTADYILIGGTNTVYDGQWVVQSVPAATTTTTDGITTVSDIYTLTLTPKGTNYPPVIGAGGSIGLIYSRFKERSPEFQHKRNQLTRGAVGLNIPRVREKIKQQYDLASSTWDQVSRIVQYERDRLLGPDAIPYVPARAIVLKAPFFCRDVNGALLPGVRPADRVTIDNTASYPYAGDYEVIDATPTPCAVESESGLVLKASAASGEIELTLATYGEGYFYDSSDDTQAGWLTVPGSDPESTAGGGGGVSGAGYTPVALTNGAQLIFKSGALPSGSYIQLPALGINPSCFMGWASPQGTLGGSAMHTIVLCSANTNGQLTLQYTDDGGIPIYSDLDNNFRTGPVETWGGDTNYMALAWRGAGITTVPSGEMNWLPVTLAGGENVVFGQGILNDGDTVVLPAGFTADKCLAIAFPYAGVASSYPAQGVGAWMDGLTAHLQFGLMPEYDSAIGGNATQRPAFATWAGQVTVLVFAWQNNSGNVTTTPIVSCAGNGTWALCKLSDGTAFGVGVARVTNGQPFPMPAISGLGASLQAITSPRSWACPNGNWAAMGVGACYLDANNNVVMTWADMAGDTWPGDATVFGVFCDTPIAVAVTPTVANIAPGATVQFSVVVAGTTNQAVTWSVDGIAGGNAGVGTISPTGLYTAPGAAGAHSITATSSVNPTLPVTSAGAVVTVT
jgi:hypothetical protein